MAPLRDPKVHRATNRGMIQDITPRILTLKVTATAWEEWISSLERTAKYATLVSAYTNVTTGMDMQIARGRFLEKDTRGLLLQVKHANSSCWSDTSSSVDQVANILVRLAIIPNG